jgi:hypothetical protein
MSPQLDYRAIRQRVDEKVKKEMRLAKFALFAVNLGVFTLFSFIAWQTYLSNGGVPPRWEDFLNIPGVARPAGDPATSALVMLTMGWVVALIIQVVSLVFDTRLGERQTRERIMGREVNKEIARLGLDTDEQQEKAKHIVRLSDDGELEEVVEDDAVLEPEVKQNRSG